jgi:hypothetical protein
VSTVLDTRSMVIWDLAMVGDNGTTFPFMEDENCNVTGYGHQACADFATMLNLWDTEQNGKPYPEDDQWSAGDIVHRWVIVNPGDPDSLIAVVEGTPDAWPVTTLWGQR